MLTGRAEDICESNNPCHRNCSFFKGNRIINGNIAGDTISVLVTTSVYHDAQ